MWPEHDKIGRGFDLLEAEEDHRMSDGQRVVLEFNLNIVMRMTTIVALRAVFIPISNDPG